MQISSKLIILLSILLSSCSDFIKKNTYQEDIPQGSVLTKNQIEKVKIGMSKTQIKELLGSPSIIDPFHNNQWHYINFSRINKKLEKNKLIVIFNDDNAIKEIIK